VRGGGQWGAGGAESRAWKLGNFTLRPPLVALPDRCGAVGLREGARVSIRGGWQIWRV
jgi:hypothetical protein